MDGERLAKRGKYAASLEKLSQILALSEYPDPVLLYNMGTIAEAAKDCRKVVLYMTGFLYQSPGDKQARQLRGKIDRCLRGDKGSGLVVIESTPRDVEVRVDHVLVGRAPILDLRLPGGSYTVQSTQPGYHPYKGTVTVDVGLEAKHTYRLEKKIYKGNLTVKTTPPGATVWLDNVKVGPAPYTRKGLATRSYLIRVEMKGWDRWVRYVSIERDQTLDVEVKLENTGTQVPVPPLPRN